MYLPTVNPCLHDVSRLYSADHVTRRCIRVGCALERRGKATLDGWQVALHPFTVTTARHVSCSISKDDEHVDLPQQPPQLCLRWCHFSAYGQVFIICGHTCVVLSMCRRLPEVDIGGVSRLLWLDPSEIFTSNNAATVALVQPHDRDDVYKSPCTVIQHGLYSLSKLRTFSTPSGSETWKVLQDAHRSVLIGNLGIVDQLSTFFHSRPASRGDTCMLEPACSRPCGSNTSLAHPVEGGKGECLGGGPSTFARSRST